ncbi:hypothetical protein D7030_06980 [Flavobacteriaceae bacterium AU392]|nr:hypothetical protein D1817_01440 [Flavobacteriaceae bacterium]RKM84872.1 hypothetical protein D7030_06980 [Flavobacteriaceae bacterium AU392]
MAFLKQYENWFSRTFIIFFILFFLFQPLYKIEFLQFSELRIRAVLKIVFLFFLLVSIILLGAKKQVVFLGLGMFLCFIFGQLFLNDKFTIFNKNIFLEELVAGDIYIGIKYLFIFVVVAVVEKIKHKEKLVKNIIDVFNKIIIINTIFIIVGLLFSIDDFRSYPQSSLRFGNQGLLDLAGESLFVYIIAVIINYFRYIKTKNVIMLIVSIMGAVLLGKKAVFLFLSILLLIHLWYLNKKTILNVILLLSSVFIFFADSLMKLVASVSPFWKIIYERYGLVSTIFSRRDVLLMDVLDYIGEHWYYLNYLFGGIDYFNKRSEFGFFDLFLAFGIIGFLIYVIFLKQYFLKDQEKVVVYLILALLFVEALSGGLFINVVPMVLFYLMAQYLKNNNINEAKNIFNSNSSSR